MRSVVRCCVVFSLLVCLLLAFSTTDLFAQKTEKRRTVGLAGSLQGGQMAFLVPIWVGDVLVLAPGFSINYDENVSTNIGVLLAPRYFIRTSRAAPYVAGRVGLQSFNPNGGSSITNLLIGLGLGGEYFINPMFSFGIEARLDAMLNNISNSSTLELDSVTEVIANIYF